MIGQVSAMLPTEGNSVFFQNLARRMAACMTGLAVLTVSIGAGPALAAEAAQSAQSAQSSPAGRAADQPAASAAAPGPDLGPNLTGDDPAAVRDALSHRAAGQSAASALTGIRRWLSLHPGKGKQTAAPDDPTARMLAFVIPATYGVRYHAKKKVLTVDVSLAAAEDPDAILLRKTVTGQSGRKLVVAPEAKAKGFIQTVDLIELATGEKTRTSVKGRVIVTNFDRANPASDYAIVIVCMLRAPYLTEQTEHHDPTEEEPTDITTRISTLHAKIDAVWLVDRKDGTVVTKRLSIAR
jgi:hypothetical protein